MSEEAVKAPLFDPWERVAPLPSELAAGAPKPVSKPSRGIVRDPWEPIVQKLRYSPSPTPLSTSIPSERELIERVRLSPAEQAKSDRFERSPGNIAELKQEIANTKNPEHKKILQEELDRLTK